MTFTFNTNIPAANNDPSVDQPDMLVNNQSTNSIIAVDHISFNTANGGQHKQVTFNNKNTPGAQTDPQSVLYTASGVASTVSMLDFRNQNGIFLLSSIKAIGVFSCVGAAGAVALDMGFNVAGITYNGGSTYVISLTPNAVNGTTAVVFVNTNSGNASINWSLSANTLTLTNAGFAVGTKISFIILQT